VDPARTDPYLRAETIPKPSAKRVLAFTNTPAESTPRTNVLPAEVDSVTMQSAWCEPCSQMCEMAAGTVRTASESERCSVV
jgi:hypothetical protein